MKTQQNLPPRNHLDLLNNITIQNLLHFKSNFDVINKKQKNKKQEINIIRQTRKMIRGLGEKERFKKAKNHFYDALCYKRPRLQTYSENDNTWFSKIQMIQESRLWDIVLYIISYVFMYLIILDTNNNFSLKASLEGIIQQRQSMMPPMMYDWKPWINFRIYMNQQLHLQSFFKNW